MSRGKSGIFKNPGGLKTDALEPGSKKYFNMNSLRNKECIG